MNHKAIYNLYKNVVTIDDTSGAFDKDGNKVQIDMKLVNEWIDPDEYKFKRMKEYPPISDQLDMIFHNGIDVWKEAIQKIKDRYPKP